MLAFAHTFSSGDPNWPKALDQKVSTILGTFSGSSLSDASYGLLNQLRVFLPVVLLPCLQYTSVTNFLQKLRGCIQKIPAKQMRSFPKVMSDLENSTATLAQIMSEEASISHTARVRQTISKLHDGKWLFQLEVTAAGVVHSIVDENQTLFEQRGVPFVGHTLTEFVQQATIVLAEGAQSAVGAEPLLLRLFKLSEAAAAVASVLSQWGHPKFRRYMFRWAIDRKRNIKSSFVDDLRAILHSWKEYYQSKAHETPLLLLVPLPLIPQLVPAAKKPPRCRMSCTFIRLKQSY